MHPSIFLITLHIRVNIGSAVASIYTKGSNIILQRTDGRGRDLLPKVCMEFRPRSLGTSSCSEIHFLRFSECFRGVYFVLKSFLLFCYSAKCTPLECCTRKLMNEIITDD